ncbi:MAG TPA: DUF2837 family protein [Candidatus Eremiobacteraceae bacterium]|nr:DUF2837 family protein [Candidatus Eremiobacteraceae bacterium]
MNPGVFVIVTALLYMFATALQMGTNAARLAGVRTKRVATGLTLFNLFGTTGRFLNLFYLPLIGSLADKAGALHDPGQFDHDMRWVMGAATIGIVIGGALVPWAARTLARGIASFERRGSLLHALFQLARPSVLMSVLRDFELPTLSMLRYSPRNLPKGFLVWNIVVMAFWVAGPLAAYYAGVLEPDYRLTAASLSGLITGISTLTLTYIVDPTSALLTDQAAHQMRPESDIKAMILYLVLTALIGTLVAQLLLVPAADIIALAAKWVNNAHIHL